MYVLADYADCQKAEEGCIENFEDPSEACVKKCTEPWVAFCASRLAPIELPPQSGPGYAN